MNETVRDKFCFTCDCLFQSSDSGGFRVRRRSPQAIAMATLSLRISIPEKNATKMMQFDPSTSVYDACRIIREKLAEASNMGQRKYPIFYSLYILNSKLFALYRNEISRLTVLLSLAIYTYIFQKYMFYIKTHMYRYSSSRED